MDSRHLVIKVMDWRGAHLVAMMICPSSFNRGFAAPDEVLPVGSHVWLKNLQSGPLP